MNPSALLQFLISGINLGCIYAAIGLGLFVVYSVTRVLNLAQGEFVMLGGMLTVSLLNIGMPLLSALLIAVIISAAIGAFLYQFIIYPARNSSGATFVFLTAGFAFATQGIALLVWGWEYRGMPNFLDTPNINLWGATIFGQTPWIVGTTLAMVLGLFFFFGHTIQGKALRACADQPLGARLVGINPEKMALFAFVLAAGLGAVAGAVITPLAMTSYGIGLPLTVKGMLAAFVGGLNRAEGVILGGMVLGLAEAFSAGLMPSAYHNVIALGVLIVVFLCRPRGLVTVSSGA